MALAGMLGVMAFLGLMVFSVLAHFGWMAVIAGLIAVVIAGWTVRELEHTGSDA